MKKNHKTEDILTKDFQAFDTMIGKTSTLDEAFQHPITLVPLSVLTLDGDLRQFEKMSLI